MKTHQDCKDCGGHGCLTVFPYGSSYCHQCPPGHSYKSKAGPNKTPEGAYYTYLPFRGVSRATAEKLGVLTQVDKEGTPLARVYPYIHQPKIRVLPKDFSGNKGFTNDHFLGLDMWTPGASKKITIVEGEDDWAAAVEIIGGTWPVYALPGANTISKILKNPVCYDALKAYDTIVIATDNDPSGNNTAEFIQKAFPSKCIRVDFGKFNDPCEFLEAGKGKEFLYAWMNAKAYAPFEVRKTPVDYLDLYNNAPEYTYVPTGITQLDDKILGLMQGHFTVIKAETGIGKSEFMRFLEYSLLKADVPFASLHVEEPDLRSLLGLVSYEMEDNLTRQDLIRHKDREEEVVQVIETIAAKGMYMSFSWDEHTSDDLIDRIRYFSEVEQCKFFFFEPIQDVVSNNDESARESTLAALSIKLSNLAASLNIGIVTIAHTNADGDPLYCKMIGKRASVIIHLDRDKHNEDYTIANTMKIFVQKNRPTSSEGPAGAMFFNVDTFMLEEILDPTLAFA